MNNYEIKQHVHINKPITLLNNITICYYKKLNDLDWVQNYKPLSTLNRVHTLTICFFN